MKRDNHTPFPPELEDENAASSSDPRQAERVWNLLGRMEHRTLEVPETEEAWEDVQQRIEEGGTARPTASQAPDRGRVSRNPRWYRRAAVAFVLTVIVLVGVWLWRLPVTVEVPPGEQQTVTLPDGSIVELNSDSRLQYVRRFQTWPLVSADRRDVILEGEGFFQVVGGASPFVVTTFNARVEVLGTQFNVRTRERATQVTLAAGQVRVVPDAESGRGVVLAQEGGQARVTTQVESERVSGDRLDRVLAWRQRGFAAVEQPLSAILAEVERRYALDVGVQGDMALTDSMSLFYLHGAAPKQIIHDICLSQGWHYRRTSQGFMLFDAPAN